MGKYEFKDSNGRIHIRISDNRIMKNIAQAQCYLDEAVLEDSNLYVPFRAGELRRSGIRNTVIGSGTVQWCTPYAHYQYMGKDMVGVMTKRHFALSGEPKEYNGEMLSYHTSGTGAGWFEKAKKNHKKTWIKKVKKIAGDG